MRACGIIAEYNPFHNGHLYHLKEAKRKTGADVMIVVMSGNFLQRGEPAITDKWSRAKTALENGADLVVELPVDYSVQPADFFAEGAVSILNSLNCDVICFGSEEGKRQPFEEAAKLVVDNEDELNRLFKTNHHKNRTYAQNFNTVLTSYFTSFPLDLSLPNNILGFAYAKEIIRNQFPMTIETIPRLNSQYHDDELDMTHTVASATAIRTALLKNNRPIEAIKPFAPVQTVESLETHPALSWRDFFPFLSYQISLLSTKELGQIYMMETGLEYRFKEMIDRAYSMEELLERMKTKQLTWVSLQRICFHILMNNTKESMRDRMKEIKAVRLLGFSSNGQGYINQYKKEFSVQLIANINKKTAGLVSQDIRAGNVYRSGNKNDIAQQDYYTKPINFIDIKD
ncbi:MAG: nucleotidyltransferase [Alkalibacterium sp.]|nr:nucleotidyltransferase [Alkalibacterium sp.]